MDTVIDWMVAFINSKYYLPVNIIVGGITIALIIYVGYLAIKDIYDHYYNNKTETIMEEIKGRGAYFPAIFDTEFGNIHILVLHEDKDAFIELVKQWNIEPIKTKKEEK